MLQAKKPHDSDCQQSFNMVESQRKRTSAHRFRRLTIKVNLMFKCINSGPLRINIYCNNKFLSARNLLSGNSS